MAISLNVIICTSSLFRGVFISPDMIKVNKIKDWIKVNSRCGHSISSLNAQRNIVQKILCVKRIKGMICFLF